MGIVSFYACQQAKWLPTEYLIWDEQEHIATALREETT